MELIKEIYVEGLIFNCIAAVIVISILIKYNFEEKKRERQTSTARQRRKERGQQLDKYNCIVSEVQQKPVKGQQLDKYNFIVAEVEPWTKEDIKTHNQIAQ